MTSLQARLFAMQDKQYAAFQAKLTPGVPVESFIGIRVPVLRKFAKEFTNEAECEDFLHQLPHEYYDENMLHGLLISEVKDYEECIRLTDTFLPFVDNWAVWRSKFDGYLTRLEMATYIVTEDFIYPRDKHNHEYGWGWSLLNTPEDLYGKEACQCNRTPEESYQRIFKHLKEILPDASDKQIIKLIG